MSSSFRAETSTKRKGPNRIEGSAMALGWKCPDKNSSPLFSRFQDFQKHRGGKFQDFWAGSFLRGGNVVGILRGNTTCNSERKMAL